MAAIAVTWRFWKYKADNVQFRNPSVWEMCSVEIRWHSVCGVSKDISVTGTVKISLRLCILNFSGPSSLKAQDESVPDTKPGHSWQKSL